MVLAGVALEINGHVVFFKKTKHLLAADSLRIESAPRMFCLSASPLNDVILSWALNQAALMRRDVHMRSVEATSMFGMCVHTANDEESTHPAYTWQGKHTI